MALRSSTLADLLSKRAAPPEEDAGDVVFALFLEPSDRNVNEGVGEGLLNMAIRTFQPRPTMVHVELVVPRAPGSSAACNFATYLGSTSAWKTDPSDNEDYYFGLTANKWRAVPIFGAKAATAVRDVCDECIDVEYSVARYLTSLWGLRRFAAMLSDKLHAPAHCATITARVLKRALGNNTLKHASAWYGPASLYAELCTSLTDFRVSTDGALVDEEAVSGIETLLQLRDDDVRKCDDTRALRAIRALTLKAAVSCTDDTASVLSQKQLAIALLRWSVLRANDGSERAS